MGNLQIMTLPNLRVAREPSRPWVVEGKRLIAQVQHTYRQLNESNVILGLSVELNPKNKTPWRIISINGPFSFTPSFSIPEIKSSTNPKTFPLRFYAPYICSLRQNREKLFLNIEFEQQGKIYREKLPLDYQCLLGDVLEKENAEIYSNLTHQYRKDPAIKRLVGASAGIPRGNLLRDVQWLEKATHFFEKNGNRYRREPKAVALGLPRGTAYVLSPTETLRYGGDCEDWSILTSAFLFERGFQSGIAHRIGHVWSMVKNTPVDFFKIGKTFWMHDSPHSISFLDPTQKN